MSSVRSEQLDRANEALEDPQFIALLDGFVHEAEQLEPLCSEPSAQSRSRPKHAVPALTMQTSRLHNTPFALLAACRT